MNAKSFTIFVIFSAALLSGGYWAGSQSVTTTSVKLICRPSAPEIAILQTNKPTVLFIGNSLVFDHGWRVPGTTTVTCARQGLLANQVLGGLENLPNLHPKVIVVGFGSVEAVQAKQSGGPVDIMAFANSTRKISETLQTRWPKTLIVWLTIPIFNNWQGPDSPTATADVDSLNKVLRTLANPNSGVVTLDLNCGFPCQNGYSAISTYDGVHLKHSEYIRLEKMILNFITEKLSTRVRTH